VTDLIAVAYPNRETAETVRAKLAQLTLQHGGEVIQTSRDDESEARLREVLEGTAAPAASAG